MAASHSISNGPGTTESGIAASTTAAATETDPRASRKSSAVMITARSSAAILLLEVNGTSHDSPLQLCVSIAMSSSTLPRTRAAIPFNSLPSPSSST